MVKNLPAMQETQETGVPSLSGGDPLEVVSAVQELRQELKEEPQGLRPLFQVLSWMKV